MGTVVTPVSVEEYLSTAYSPDVDYVDGEIQERNMGEQEHATIQKFFILYLSSREEQWDILVLQENRVQTSASRYRIPDICVMHEDAPFGGITRDAPLLCIEVLSPEDRMSRMQAKVEDYIGMGVRAVWIVDPYSRRIVCADRSVTLRPADDVLTVHGTDIAVPRAEVFRELDRRLARERVQQ